MKTNLMLIRNLQIIRMRQDGKSYKDIGATFSITSCRARQICLIEDDRVNRKKKYLKGTISTTLYNLQIICDQLQMILKPDLINNL